MFNRSSFIFLIGQIEQEARSFVTSRGTTGVFLNIRTPMNMTGKGWYDAAVYGISDVNEFQKGDWVMLWGFRLSKQKSTHQVAEGQNKEFYRMIISGNGQQIINLTSLVNNGEDYLSKLNDSGSEFSGETADISKIVNEIERELSE